MKVARLDHTTFRALINHRKQITAKGRKKARLRKFKVPRVPTQAIHKYHKFLDSYFGRLKELVDINLIPKLPDMITQANKHNPQTKRQDSPTDDLKYLLGKISLELEDEFDDETIAIMLTEVAHIANKVGTGGFLANIKDVAAIDLFVDEPYLDLAVGMFASSNVSLISKATDDMLGKIESKVFDAFRNGERSGSLVDDIKSILDTSESRAAFIARDQIGKLGGQLDMLRQTEAGVSKYVWRTMGDERVRDEHDLQDGETYSWDDPPDTGHPGEDYNCRCWAEPILDDLIDGTQPDQDQGDGGDEG